MSDIKATKGSKSAALAALAMMTILAGPLSGCGRPAASSVLATPSAAPTSDVLTNGVWAKQTIIVSESSALGVKSTSKIQRLLLVKMKRQGDQLFTSEQLCDTNSISSGGASLVFPEGFKRAIPVRNASYTISTDSKGVTLEGTQAVEVLGATLADAVKDPLPTSAQDASVADQDGDGHPGVTIDISAKAAFISIKGKIYLAQRTLTQESARLDSADLIRGKLLWSTEQKILGSDSTILGSVQPTVKPIADSSVFTMRRMAAADTCTTILNQKDKLFDLLK